LNFDVVDFPEETTVRERRNDEVVRRVAEREVYGGDESFISAKVADDEGLLESLAHGLLHEYGRTIRELRKDVGKLRGRNCYIEDGVSWSKAYGFGDGTEGARNATPGCEFCSFGPILIHEADNREAGLFIGGQVGGANDPACADDDDGTNLLWAGLPGSLDSCENPRVKAFSGGRIWHRSFSV
jgi:hypothetical protein